MDRVREVYATARTWGRAELDKWVAQGAAALLSVKGVVVLAVVAVAGAGAVGSAVHPGERSQRAGTGTRVERGEATVVVVPDTTAPAPTTVSAPTAVPTPTTAPMPRAAPMPTAALAPAAGGRRAKVVAMRARAVVEPAAQDLSALQAELKVIGEARRALRAGDGGAALLALDQHARQFPSGALVEEVELLRMRALIAAGDGARARALGQAFLARRAQSPLAGAVRALFGFSNPVNWKETEDEN